jgi:hypothetical protein
MGPQAADRYFGGRRLLACWAAFSWAISSFRAEA